MAMLNTLIEGFKAIFLTKQILFIIGGILGVGFIIAWHEFGHFLFAKLFGVKVPSFSIGMGPKVIKTNIGQTQFSLSAIPLGGYVEIAMYPEDDSNPKDRQYFINKPYWQKLCVLSGGILFNMIFAYITLIALFKVGMPITPFTISENIQPVIEQVLKDSPAETAGLKADDRIIAIDGELIGKDMAKHIASFSKNPGKTIQMTINRKGQDMTLPVTLGEKTETADGKKLEKPVGFIGFAPVVKAIDPLPLGQAIKRGTACVHFIVGQIAGAVKGMFSNRSIDGLGGPIMIISQTIKSAERGILIFLTFLAYISISLAVLNLLPLPILDGGQVVTSTVEAIIRRPLPIVVRNVIALSTWAMFLALSIFLVFRDIKILRQIGAQTKTEQKK
jgi:regulator of sigma E protease